MTTPGETEGRALQRAALDHLWVYMREPAEMAEKGEPQVFVEGDGVWVTDTEGRRFMDPMSGLGLKNVGYGRAEIAEAAYDQMRKLSYMPSGAVAVPTVKLAEKLASMTPGSLSRSYFVSGGSEAVETALKLARAYHKRRGEAGRYKIISRRGSYHGATAGVMALGGAPRMRRTDYEPFAPGFLYAPHPHLYRCEFGSASQSECATKCAQAIEDLIVFHGPETVAAVVAEPMATSVGVVVPGDEYWPMVREICDRYGVLLIVDEVMCGFGRTGKMFGGDHWGVIPDIMTLAKGLTSGYVPMGAAVAKKEVADLFIGSEDVKFVHMISFGGHPVAAAAALENIAIIERERLVENAAAMGTYLLDGLKELEQKHSVVGEAAGRGLMCSLELVRDKHSKEYFPAEAEMGDRLTGHFKANGVLLRGGNTVRIMPPLSISRSEVDFLIRAVDRSLASVENELNV